MKQINNFDECLEYVNRLGIVSPSRPIGWQQNDLVAIISELETASVNQKQTSYPYPLKVQFHRGASQGVNWHRLIFRVNGRYMEMVRP